MMCIDISPLSFSNGSHSTSPFFTPISNILQCYSTARYSTSKKTSSQTICSPPLKVVMFSLQMGKQISENLRISSNFLGRKCGTQTQAYLTPNVQSLSYSYCSSVFSLLTKVQRSVGSTQFSYLYLIILTCSLCEIFWNFMR